MQFSAPLKAIKRIRNKISVQCFMLFHITHFKRNKQIVWDTDDPLNNPSFHQDPNWVSKAAWDMPSYFCSTAMQSWKVFRVPQQGHRANSLSLECLSLHDKKQKRVIYDKTLKAEFWTPITWSEALFNVLCGLINFLFREQVYFVWILILGL